MKQLTIVNRTDDTLVYAQAHCEHAVLLPAGSLTIKLGKLSASLFLAKQPETLSEKSAQWSIEPHRFAISIPLAFGASWKAVEIAEGCPWRAYRRRVSRKHHKLLIIPRRDMASFLADMPDSLPLSSLLLPGTHDTMAFYGWPISQCQSLDTPLAQQLRTGIRVLDIRLAIENAKLVAYHGLTPQFASFQSILATLHAFLTSPASARETVVVSIKQEDFALVDPRRFSQLVHAEIAASAGGRALWFLENRVPRLGEVRGRAVLFSRFGGDGAGWEGGLEGLGIHPTTWPDSAKDGFEWTCKSTRVRTHDWYSIPSFLSIPEKTALATDNLLPRADADAAGGAALNISFFSAASFPLAFPPTVARGFGWPQAGLGVEGVNARVGRWLLDVLGAAQAVRVRGWTFMDFYADPQGGAVVPLLVECNYRARKAGEEGWE